MNWLIAFIHQPAPSVTPKIERLGYEVHNPYPGYLFFNYAYRWPEIAAVDGVSRILGDRTTETLKPHILEQPEVDRILAYESPPEQQPRRFRHGDIVRIKIGAATGYFGRVERKKSGRYEVAFKTLVDGIPTERVWSFSEHSLELAVPV